MWIKLSIYSSVKQKKKKIILLQNRGERETERQRDYLTGVCFVWKPLPRMRH